MRAFGLLICLAACGSSDDVAPPSREVTTDAVVAASGLSDEITFRIPDHTRSITIVVEGAPDGLYALGSFELGDGVDLVQLPTGSPAAAMETSYQQEQIGQMPGALFQSIRLGTFTHLYPYRPDQTVIAGTGRLRVASTKPGPVSVTIVMPEDNGANVLALDLYIVSDTLADPDLSAFEGELDRVFAQAAITVNLGGMQRLTGTAFERITDFNEPQETPTSQSAMLTTLATGAGAALDVYFVEGLPIGVAGLSLGTPGPPLRGSYYYGVIVRGGFPEAEMARIVAHEVAHFLALQHVQNRGVSGKTYPDPLDDTVPGLDNLMEDGTVLTPGQQFALSRSALLQPAP